MFCESSCEERLTRLLELWYRFLLDFGLSVRAVEVVQCSVSFLYFNTLTLNIFL